MAGVGCACDCRTIRYRRASPLERLEIPGSWIVVAGVDLKKKNWFLSVPFFFKQGVLCAVCTLISFVIVQELIPKSFNGYLQSKYHVLIGFCDSSWDLNIRSKNFLHLKTLSYFKKNLLVLGFFQVAKLEIVVLES